MLTAVNKKELIRETGEWLHGFQWQFFLTLTFRRSMSLWQSERYFKNYIKQYDNGIIYFFVLEPHRLRHGYHVHLLLGKTSTLIKWKHGNSDIQPYDSQRGAVYYVAKYIIEPTVFWDINATASDLT